LVLSMKGMIEFIREMYDQAEREQDVVIDVNVIDR
jgi:hypothetical protein